MSIEANDEPGSRIVYDGLLAIGVNALIGFGVLCIVITLWRLSRDDTTQAEKYLLLGAWGILPPIWFMLEYFYIYLPYGVKGSFNFFQYGQEIAQKVWAAIFALISVSIYRGK